MAVNSILIVCRGNICRSPMAEGYFKHQLNNQSSIHVSSGGISALVGYSADENAQNVMKNHGIDISEHRAKVLTENLVRNSDLILVMTQSHLKTIARQYISAKGKTFLLGHWSAFEIQDPYTQPYEAFEKGLQQIKLAWQDWKTRILSC